MAMAISLDCTALTVSADHLVGRYDLLTPEGTTRFTSVGTAFKTKHSGNSAIVIRSAAAVRFRTMIRAELWSGSYALRSRCQPEPDHNMVLGSW
ncbi:hypothetical protein M405DRAFT_496433 [Rhizopogon salebrosus TDB-379]|nr:hypothetical protein M405DRAFT_496433 [Rhizopogon salebrosus TDB-379]